MITGFLTTSCSKVLTKIYGMNEPEMQSDENILQAAKKYNIEKDVLYKIDSTYFNYVMENYEDPSKGCLSNLLQPLQALYFDSDKKLISHIINCRFQGYPNLKWNRNGTFDTFVPSLDSTMQCEGLDYDDLLTYAKNISDTKNINDLQLEKSDYYVVVIWNIWMGRQAKNFIKQIKENALLSEDSKISIIYLNSDNVYFDDDVTFYSFGNKEVK